MLIGALNAREEIIIKIGKRNPLAMYKISFIKASPCELVAVTVLAPAAEDPTQALMALCSDSTVIISVLTLLSA